MTGITPAHAGKSGAPTLATAATGDHPRVCGEKISQTRRNLPLGGSPPRVRGKERGHRLVAHSPGITPAHAGKSGSAAWHRWACRDHPRVCGEKPAAVHHSTLTRGSPPRVREKVDLGLVLFHLGRITPACAGKVRVQAPVQEHRGITPAHAGKRPGWADSGCQRGDHPCVCGEKIFEHPVSLANQGSLPVSYTHLTLPTNSRV